MKTKTQNYTIIDKPNEKKATEKGEAWDAAALIVLQFVACCLVGVLLGIGLATFALSL